jgi:serine/threonine-protein kinase
MEVTTPLVLPDDIIIVPVKELRPDIRSQIDADDGDYAISRPRSRSPSRIVDAATAELLKRFRQPTPIAEAVLIYSLARSIDAAETLENAFPLIQKLVNANLLVPEGAEQARRIEPSLELGATFASVTIRQCIQVLEDTEVYQAEDASGHLVALKISRPGTHSSVQRALAREAEILERLAGESAPLLCGAGAQDGSGFLLSAWCEGIPASAAAGDLRRPRREQGPEDLLQLATAICRAYAAIHGRGVIQSDVHPRNVLVCADGTVKLIDFGLARIDDGTEHHVPGRGGIGFYFEPEYARAHRLDEKRPPSTFLGEQYGLGALLYLLFTGAHYINFSLHRDEMFRQIEEEPALPFSQRNARVWPEVERAIGRALEKDAARRFESVGKLAEALESCMDSARRRARQSTEGAAGRRGAAGQRLLRELRTRLDPSGPLFRQGLGESPTCSVNYGAAGIAYALYRFAMIEGSAPLLAAADLWSDRARTWSSAPGAFYEVRLDITEKAVGRVSLYHTASGIHCVQALISHAMGDFVSMQAAVKDFVAASDFPCDSLDVTLGKASTLIGCATLLEAMPESLLVNAQPLREQGERRMREIWASLDSFGPVGSTGGLNWLGIAHGWAGILYSTMRWCLASGTSLPAGLGTRLHELAMRAELVGRGARWKRKLSHHGARPGDYTGGWCNGSAGFVLLWILAARVFRSVDYTTLAEKAAWNAWDTVGDLGSLCCGLAGAGYAFLALHQHLGDPGWLDRAREVCERAADAPASSAMRNDSLYKGDLGIALLTADLSSPEMACMPLFESEGWPPRVPA